MTFSRVFITLFAIFSAGQAHAFLGASKCWSWKRGCGKGTPKAIAACFASHLGRYEDADWFYEKMYDFMLKHHKCHAKAQGKEIDTCVHYAEDVLTKQQKFEKRHKFTGDMTVKLQLPVHLYGLCLKAMRRGENTSDKFLEKAAKKFIATRKLSKNHRGESLITMDKKDELVNILNTVFSTGKLPKKKRADHFLFRRYDMEKKDFSTNKREMRAVWQGHALAHVHGMFKEAVRRGG